MGIFNDLTGKKFGRLTAVYAYKDPSGRRFVWHCQCDCGGEKEVCSSSLTSGRTRSCGCIHRESLAERNTSHGHTKERLYRVWKGMKARCFIKSHKSYPRYGGRGITVCDEWNNDYLAFRTWAFANGYDPNSAYMQCTIDRINHDGNYCPENCRFVGNIVQANNTSRNIHLEYNGEVKTTAEWARIMNVPVSRLYCRMGRQDLTTEELLKLPRYGPRAKKRTVKEG